MSVAIDDIIAAKLLVQLGWHTASAARADLLGLDVSPAGLDLVGGYARKGVLGPARVEKIRKYVNLYARVRREALYAAIVEQARLVPLPDLKRVKTQLESERYARPLGEILIAERKLTRESHQRVVDEAQAQLSREDERLLDRYRRARFDGVERSVTRDPHIRIETAVFTIKNLFRSPESQRTEKVEAQDAAARPRPAIALESVARAPGHESTPGPSVRPELAKTVEAPPHAPEELAVTIDDPTPLIPVSTGMRAGPPGKAEAVVAGRRSPTGPGYPRRIGDYEVQGLLGRGGMGMVLLARQPDRSEPVAIKLSLSKDPEAKARIKREILATSMLSHENIVQVLDAGETDDGSPYLVMELVRGRELRDLMKERGAFAPRDALAVFVQILGAAGAAHSAGIVHRDLKPENVLIAEREGNLFAKVMDFGLARIVELDPEHAGRVFQTVATNVVSGSPQYLSPEQVLGEPVDGRTDLYALGIVLFELLTGTLPFTGATLGELVRAHVASKPKRLAEFKPGAFPPSLDLLVTQLLEKVPSRRPPDADTVLRTIEDKVLPELAIPAAPDLMKTVHEASLDESFGRTRQDDRPPSFVDIPRPPQDEAERHRGITKVLRRLFRSSEGETGSARPGS